MTAQTPIDLYHGVLEALDYQADSQGEISYKNEDGTLSPELVDGKRLVIPTPEILRRISTDNSIIAFHPLCENITMGESLIIRRMRMMVTTKISLMMMVLGEELLRIATEKGPLTAETTELGKVLANATPKTLEHFANVMNHMDPIKHQMVSVYIRRKGQLGDESFRRLAVVRFPIMDEFQEGKPDNMIFDVKISKKDKVTIGELFKFMLKDIEKPNGYSVGTNSASAPNFVALMLAFAKIAGELSAHALAMKSKINKTILLPKLHWVEALNDLSLFMGVIPPLAENEGVSETANANQAIQATLAPAPAQAPVATLTAPQQPVGKYATTNTVQHTPQQQAVVTHQQQVPMQQMQVQQPMQMQVQQSMYPTMQQMQQPVQQQPDFASLVTQQVYANNPQMQMQQMQPMQPMYPQQMPMQMMPNMMPNMMPFPGMMPNQMQMPAMPGMMPGMPGMMQPGMMPQQPIMPVNYIPGQGAGKYQTA